MTRTEAAAMMMRLLQTIEPIDSFTTADPSACNERKPLPAPMSLQWLFA